MVKPTRIRSGAEVLDDHLRESQTGSIEDDLARNYAEDVVILTGRGIYRGHRRPPGAGKTSRERYRVSAR